MCNHFVVFPFVIYITIVFIVFYVYVYIRVKSCLFE